MKLLKINYFWSKLILLIFTLSCSVYNETSLTDIRDGNKYPVVKVGEQLWMATNLAYLPAVFPSESDSGIYVYRYQGRDIKEALETGEYKTYGVLYNWAVAMGLPLSGNMNLNPGILMNNQGICPEGWHLPSNDEVQIMEDFLETLPDFPKDDKRRHTGDVGKKLKSDHGWFEEGNGNNETGFSALPSGIRYQEGNFTKEGKYGYFWTATEYMAQNAFYRFMVYNSDGTFMGYPSKKIGMPVRCLKD